jgi:hypothetical protein
MDRFPALTIYRYIYLAIGYLIIIGSFFVAYQSAYNEYYGELDFVQFGIAVGVGVFFGGFMIITAELIGVLVSIEGHLSNMNWVLSRDSKAQDSSPKY